MMNKPSLSVCLLLFLVVSCPLAAGTREKQVIALKTGDFDLAETDVSDLAIGEARTIVTDSGRTIDIIRANEGFEIYVDGELLDMPHEPASGHVIHRNEVVVECTAEDGDAIECEHDLVFFGDWDVNFESLHGDGVSREIIVKSVDAECFSDEEGSCEDHGVWISNGDDISFGELHADDLHGDEDGQGKVVRIHRTHAGEDGSDSVEREIVVIRKADKL